MQHPIDSPEHAAVKQVTRLTSGSLLARNTFWNLFGQAMPMATALFTIPVLIRHIGTSRFGILTIAWAVVGYFSLFDLGLGRALTNLVAQNLSEVKQHRLPAIVWTANSIMAVMGIVGAIVFASISPLLSKSLLKIPAGMETETLQSLLILSVSVPLVISSAGFRGILEAQQKFALLNLVRIPMGIATFLAPVLVLPFTNRLPALIASLVFSRLLFLIACICLVLHEMPTLRASFKFDKAQVLPLCTFGGWMTVSNTVSPLMIYVDRLLIGSLIAMSAVAYYATPYEVTTKLLIVPWALAGVMFPAFSTAMAMDRWRGQMLYRRAVKYTSLFLVPVCMVAILWGREFLEIWLGHDFAMHSAKVLQILAVGVIANGLAAIPFALIQGAGRADVTGKLHLCELPFYLVTLWLLTNHLGIVGAAFAWMLRVTADCIVLFILAERVLDFRNRIVVPVCGAIALGGATVLISPALRGLVATAGFTVGGLTLFCFVAWSRLISEEERSAVRTIIALPFASRIKNQLVKDCQADANN